MDSKLGVEAVMGSPILKLASVGSKQRGDGMAPGAYQLSEQMLAKTLSAKRAAGGLGLATLP